MPWKRKNKICLIIHINYGNLQYINRSLSSPPSFLEMDETAPSKMKAPSKMMYTAIYCLIWENSQRNVEGWRCLPNLVDIRLNIDGERSWDLVSKEGKKRGSVPIITNYVALGICLLLGTSFSTLVKMREYLNSALGVAVLKISFHNISECALQII